MPALDDIKVEQQQMSLGCKNGLQYSDWSCQMIQFSYLYHLIWGNNLDHLHLKVTVLNPHYFIFKKFQAILKK